MKAGRPTNYTEDLLELAESYLISNSDAVPTVVGLCLFIGIAKATAYRWADEGKARFKDILDEVMENQEHQLVNKGLMNEINPVITKMMMAKHGYHDAVKSDITSSDGTMTPRQMSDDQLLAIISNEKS